MFGLHYVLLLCAYSANGGQKGALYPLGLELQVVFTASYGF